MCIRDRINTNLNHNLPLPVPLLHRQHDMSEGSVTDQHTRHGRQRVDAKYTIDVSQLKLSCLISHFYFQSLIIFYCMIFVNSVISLSDRHVCLRLSGHRYFAHETNFLLELLHISALQCPECIPFKTY